MVITGGTETVLYLKNFHQDIYTVLGKQVRSILRRTSSAASSKFPHGAYTVKFGSGSNPTGLISTAPGSASGVRWTDADAGAKAAIYDALGRRYSGTSPQVLGAIGTLNARLGKPQRILWPSWMRERDSSMREIDQAFAAAERSLQSKMDGV